MKLKPCPYCKSGESVFHFLEGRAYQAKLDREAVGKINVGIDLIREETRNDALAALDEAAKEEK